TGRRDPARLGRCIALSRRGILWVRPQYSERRSPWLVLSFGAVHNGRVVVRRSIRDTIRKGL
ncbi:MAG: hypothetical protein ACRD2O_12085, partial [Terriglobia bacterium]